MVGGVDMLLGYSPPPGLHSDHLLLFHLILLISFCAKHSSLPCTSNPDPFLVEVRASPPSVFI